MKAVGCIQEFFVKKNIGRIQSFIIKSKGQFIAHLTQIIASQTNIVVKYLS